MQKLSEQQLRRIIEDGETTTVELKVVPPRPAELAERLYQWFIVITAK